VAISHVVVREVKRGEKKGRKRRPKGRRNWGRESPKPGKTFAW